MNRQQMDVWLEAMLAEHAAGRLSTALLRGAFDVCDEVRRQWGRLAAERSQARYVPPEQTYRSLAQRLDEMAEEASKVVYRNPSLRPEPPKPKPASRFQPETMAKLHEASLKTFRLMQDPIIWSVCSRCGDMRVRGVIGLPERGQKNAYLYVSGGDSRVWRWMAGSCAGKPNAFESFPTPEGRHYWESCAKPAWLNDAGEDHT